MMVICNCLWANDTLNQRTIKGIDVSVDFGSLSTTFSREIQLLDKLVAAPNIVSSISPDYTYAEYVRSFTKVNLDLVFALQPHERLGSRRELKFGLSYLASNSGVTNNGYIAYDSFDNSGRKLKKSYSYNIYHHREQIQCSYIVYSKVYRNAFRFYTGLNLGLALSTWEGIERNRTSLLYVQDFWYLDSSIGTGKSYSIGKFTAITPSIILPLGIKYMYSCDLHFFSSLGFGYAWTPALKPNALQRQFAFSLGVRYNFGMAEMEQEKKHTFW